MGSDLIVMGAGLLSLAIISAPIWLAPILARWPKNEGTTSDLWMED